MQDLPIGIQDFRKLREGGMLYVDKTKIIHHLVSKGSYYFLSRPRRFGKSLTLSVIKELFLGSRALFEGLWIEDQWDWDQQHPVIHISFSSMDYQGVGLEKAILIALREKAEEYRIILEANTVKQCFSEFLKKLAVRGRIVLLIDEYDKPIVDYLDNLDQAKANQEILKSFYSIIKDSDPYFRFLLVTGVSKFSKVSIFSDLNNLQDITLYRTYNGLCGYDQGELEEYFHSYLDQLGEDLHWDREKLLSEVRLWYNGYSWTGKSFVYNPFSIMSFFLAGNFHNFWFGTGTPTFLIRTMQDRGHFQMEKIKVDTSIFESYNLENTETRSLLFQTGYLTVKEVDEYNLYTLDYPNREVRESMYRHLISAFRHADTTSSGPLVIQLQQAFQAGELNAVISIIKSLFKNIPSQIFLSKAEAYYHSIIYLVFKYLGIFIESEVNTANGRLDAVVEAGDRVYILEFKLDQSCEIALAQIRSKGYGEKYSHSGKEVFGVGINFSSELKTVENWSHELLSSPNAPGR